jgi:hypothetical protein
VTRIGILRVCSLVALAGLLLTAYGSAQRPEISPPPRSTTPAAPKFVPKFEPLAETRLLMEGLNLSNYRSLHKLLKNKPADNDTWVFARGQALLIAETGNLLLLRPPRNNGRDTWMKLAMSMRSSAGSLARAIAARDYARSRAGLAELTTACNRCHTTFRVPVRVAPDMDKAEPGG